MTEAEARGVILEMERRTKSRAARIALAKHATAGIGNISPEGRALYAAYAAALAR
jgi:hypothetical protein